MGMHDWVELESQTWLPWPDDFPEYNPAYGYFQTKSLANRLQTYWINKDGVLYLPLLRDVILREPEDYPGEWYTNHARFDMIHVPFTGELEIHTSIEGGYWAAFRMWLSDGVVIDATVKSECRMIKR